MDVRSLKYFYTVAEHGQFTKAASQLHISQPALSNTIKALEEELGCILFERSTKTLKLTEPGEILYKHAGNILTEIKKVYEEMADAKNMGKGRIHLGMIESYRYFISQIISVFKAKHPSVSMKIRELGPNDIIKDLKNYDIHLGITSAANEQENFEYIPILQEKYVMIIPLDHPFAYLDNINISDLKNETFIHSLEGFKSRETFLQACENNGFSPAVEFETETLETACSLVENGLGVSIIPESFLALNPSKNRKMIYIKDYSLNRTVYLVYQSNRYLPPVIRDFIDIAIEYSNKFRGQ